MVRKTARRAVERGRARMLAQEELDEDRKGQLHRLSGYDGPPGGVLEERLIRPVDIYPQFRARTDVLPRSGETSYQIRGIFVRVEAEDGTSGTVGRSQKTRRSL